MLILLNQILSSLKQTSLNPALRDQILTYLDLLDRWNQAYNLTAITGPQERMIKHIADSLSVIPYMAIDSATTSYWLDVGTGAGLPGIPLALFFPNSHWVLLDGNAKKTRFLVQVKAVLGLSNVTVVHSRIENYSPDSAQIPYFNGIITRAWTAVSEIIEKTRHLRSEQTTLWAMKGAYPSEELESVSIAYAVHRLSVFNLNEERHLVEISDMKTKV